MKPKSAHKKGNRFENYLIEYLRENLDAGTHRTYSSGRGLDKQDVIIPNYKIELEAKNQKTINLIDWWEQCKSQEFGNKGMLAIRNPRKAEFQEVVIVISIEDLVDILKNKEGEIETGFDKNTKWKVKRLKDAAHDLFKSL
jgi:hypothetical protein